MASIEEILRNKGIPTLKVSKRYDGREADQIRDVRITRGYSKHAIGSCLIEMGDTKVICTASMEEKVPPHIKNTGTGWVTAEYGMLPSSTSPRSMRESSRGKVGGRTHEIQRLIGRSLRAAIDTKLLGEKTIWIDCDVLQADGGTRTASVTGAWIALDDAVRTMTKQGIISRNPIIDQIAAISVGMVDGEPVLDLNYYEDSKAEVDMNIIMTGKGKLIEVQGTAEGQAFSKEELLMMLELAEKGIRQLMEKQLAAIKS